MQKNDRHLIRAAAVLGLSGVVLLVVGPEPQWLTKHWLWGIPEGIGAVLAATLALAAGLAVLKAANIQAIATREAAEKQAKAAIDAALEETRALREAAAAEQAFARQQDEELRDHQRRTVAAALLGELTAIEFYLADHKRATQQARALFSRPGNGGAQTQGPVSAKYFPAVSAPVFEAQVQHIGLLSIDLVQSLARVYGDIGSLRAMEKTEMTGSRDLQLLVIDTALSLTEQLTQKIAAVRPALEKCVR